MCGFPGFEWSSDMENDYDFEIEAALLRQNLNFLKSLSLRKYTLYKKWDELRHYTPPQPELVQRAKNRIWRPDETVFTCETPADTGAMMSNPVRHSPQGHCRWRQQDRFSQLSALGNLPLFHQLR